MDLPEFFEHADITVTRATQEHLDAMHELINNSFSYQDEAKGEKRIVKEVLAKRIANEPMYVWLSDKQLVACLYLAYKPQTIHFGLLCITEGMRGTGLAAQILQSLEEYTLARGDTTLELDYMSLSPWLKGYYERYGYNETGEREDIGWCQLICMTKSVTS